MARSHGWGGRLVLFALLLVAAACQSTQGKGNGTSAAIVAPAGRWLMTTNLVNSLKSTDPITAAALFNTPGSFVKSNPAGGYAATPIVGYTSYAQFAADLADGAFPSQYHWVMYGLESTTNSPLIEKQHPDVYLKKFADLAHAHGLQVMEVPGQDLVFVSGADCRKTSGETTESAYLHCHIPADASSADIALIESQGAQANPYNYGWFTKTAAAQAETANPAVTVFGGLTTDRGDSAATIEKCWSLTHGVVSGYWMNSTSSTLAEAATVLNFVLATTTAKG